MAECKHENFKVDAKVYRLTQKEEGEVTGYTMDLEVHCADCLMPFRFLGMPMGVHPSRPTVNFEGVEARIPIQPV